jgi:hypothetical protein
MTQADLHPLYQQMGEVIRGLRSLAETIEIRHSQTEKLYELMRSDVAILRQDQRDADEKLDCVICVMQNDIERLRSSSTQNADAIDKIARTVRGLSQPISEIIALRSRAAGLILAFGVIGSAVVWLIDPVYRWFVESKLLGR